MSYILDALRKSEQDRQRGRVPDLNSYKDEPVAAPPARNVWPWVTLVVVFVNLAIVLFFWAPWRSGPVAPATLQSAAQTPAAIQEPPPAPATAPAPQPQPVATAVRPEPIPQTVVVDNRPPVQVTPTIVTPEAAAPVDRFEESYAAPAPSAVYMPHLEELSAADRVGIPDMTFSSHMYSSMPRFRSIIINGKRLKEGEYFTQTLQVREITDKGVIMSNGNVLFTVDVLGRWAQ